MRAGALRQRIWIQKPGAATQNSHGEETTPYVDEVEVWMSLEPLTGREYFAAETRQSEVTHKATMRYRSGMNTKKRLRLGTRLFDIQAVMDTTERHRELQLMCVERAHNV